MNTMFNHNSSSTSGLLASCSASCAKIITRIQNTKSSLLAEFRQTSKASERMLRLALNEAEALASETEFPLLTFPTLAREKAEAVAAWQDRQQALWVPELGGLAG